MGSNRIVMNITGANPDEYILFYSASCGYSRKALELLYARKLAHTGYDVKNIEGGLNAVLDALEKNKAQIKFNPSHRTVPIIFYNKKFIGGYGELSSLLGE